MSYYKLFFNLPESPHPRDTTLQRLSIPLTLSLLLLSALIILGAIIPLFRLDFPIILYIRSIHVPVLEELGRIGNRLGHGNTLVFISLALAGIGYRWEKENVTRAGLQSLLSHGVAGLIIQIIKHLLGRPRPRLTHQGHWEIGPSLQGGLDAFPSGHSTASFAVAAVLARYFPNGAWIWYGLAGFVALSRIVKGSHFPSDALTGILIGFLVGYIIARPLDRWIRSLVEGLASGLPIWVGGFTLVWVTFHHSESGTLYTGMFLAGLIITILGAGLGIFFRAKKDSDSQTRMIGYRLTPLLVGLGLALFTESLLVAFLALLAGIAWWAGPSHPSRDSHEDQPTLTPKKLWAQEVLIGGAVIALLLGIQQLKGLIPLT